ncbi:low-density lipoprotein receptor repeat domain-containing protein cueball isoform X2 [Nomia melanderi]|uniref:low-density lipoprotein receptor repeat domain-containing protein cueball isoform X2 n=1 Tax=Nomia melanderi TaxID=2448451 RepID=UPI0013045FDA|nr:protein cueball isoform X2 [Nomia melanderi]
MHDGIINLSHECFLQFGYRSGRNVSDLAVVIGNSVEFFFRNKTLAGQIQIKEAESLTGVAYDDTTNTLFFSDTRSNYSVFSINLKEKNDTAKPLVTKQENNHIVGLAFDAKTRNLFWSDGVKSAIMRMHVPLDGPPEKPALLHDLKGSSARGIALDLCNSRIYWVNSNKGNQCIERSNLDGTERTSVIKKDMLYEPLAVAIDHAERKLYWTDDIEGERSAIERTNLDGRNNQTVIRIKRHQPVYLAIDRDTLYWSDRVHKRIWSLPKNAEPEESPVEFRPYRLYPHFAELNGIITRDNTEQIDCERYERIMNYANATLAPEALPSLNNLPTGTEESEMVTEKSQYCLNDGIMDDTDEICRCKPGFTGAHCEINLCHNYCLQGSCSINTDNLPTCKCSGTFIGPRCATDPCINYCLHGGQCSVQNEKPVCKCKYSEGSRCENPSNVTKTCETICAKTEIVPMNHSVINCRCDKTNETSAQMIMTNGERYEYTIIGLTFAVLTIVLMLVIIALSYYVNTLRKRPRIRKRFVVSKGGITPLTSRPQIPDNQCEITIENCCNMNICETPCFEPKLRTAVAGSNDNKKEEKNSLLDNMEGNSW